MTLKEIFDKRLTGKFKALSNDHVGIELISYGPDSVKYQTMYESVPRVAKTAEFSQHAKYKQLYTLDNFANELEDL